MALKTHVCGWCDVPHFNILPRYVIELLQSRYFLVTWLQYLLSFKPRKIKYVITVPQLLLFLFALGWYWQTFSLFNTKSQTNFCIFFFKKRFLKAYFQPSKWYWHQWAELTNSSSNFNSDSISSYQTLLTIYSAYIK